MHRLSVFVAMERDFLRRHEPCFGLHLARSGMAPSRYGGTHVGGGWGVEDTLDPATRTLAAALDFGSAEEVDAACGQVLTVLRTACEPTAQGLADLAGGLQGQALPMQVASTLLQAAPWWPTVEGRRALQALAGQMPPDEDLQWVVAAVEETIASLPDAQLQRMATLGLEAARLGVVAGLAGPEAEAPGLPLRLALALPVPGEETACAIEDWTRRNRTAAADLLDKLQELVFLHREAEAAWTMDPHSRCLLWQAGLPQRLQLLGAVRPGLAARFARLAAALAPVPDDLFLVTWGPASVACGFAGSRSYWDRAMALCLTEDQRQQVLKHPAYWEGGRAVGSDEVGVEGEPASA